MVPTLELSALSTETLNNLYMGRSEYFSNLPCIYKTHDTAHS